MRVLSLVFFCCVAVVAENLPTVTSETHVTDNLSIPARLSKTIDSNKCKPGDSVEMKTLEAVLLANGLVMPENAKLYGKVLGAASRQNDQPSWVVLVVDRAAWKDHSVSLRAFVAAQITSKAKPAAGNGNLFTGSMRLSDFQHGRYIAGSQPTSGSGRSRSYGRISQDATDGGDLSSDQSNQRLDDLYIQQGRNGAVFLLSHKPHLKLPSGTMFMLRNQAAPTEKEADAARVANVAR